MSSLNRMMGMLPTFVANDPIVRAFFEAVSAEVEQLISDGRLLPGEWWVQTVTDAIVRLERIFGVVPDVSASINARRSALLAKLRSGPVSTYQRLREVAESYAGMGIDVVEVQSDYRVDISIQNYLGLPPYLEAMKASVRAALPAHLGIVYTIRWLLWDEILARGQTWEALKISSVTWEALKEHGEVP